VKITSLPYLKVYKDRHGKIRRYVRRWGKSVVLKLDPTHPDFLGEYQAAISGLKPDRFQPEPGTWHALVTEYLGSAQFKALKKRTQIENRREAERIRLKWGTLPVDRLETRHILKWQDQLADKPGSANNMLATLKMLLAFGRSRGFRHSDPAKGVKELKAGSYRSWTDQEIEAYQARWGLGTIQRLIFDLALYSGQRRGDLVAMTWHHVAEGVMGVVQEKTGERVSIPVHPALKESMSAGPRRGIAVLTRSDGAPFSVREVSGVFSPAVAEAGLPASCVLHGLRYSAARRLAEAGATPHEIAAVTGHRTLGMVEKYTRDASRKKLAGEAIRKMKAWGTGTEPESV
jgi:integrase